MPEPARILDELEALLERMDDAGTDAGRSNLFYSATPLIAQLEGTAEARGNGYIGEKLGSLRTNLASLCDREESNSGVDYAYAARLDIHRLRLREGFNVGA